MTSMVERLRSMGTTLGQRAANLICNQERLIAQFQDDTASLRTELEMEKGAHLSTLTSYDVAQKQIESLSSEVAARQERIDTLEPAARSSAGPSTSQAEARRQRAGILGEPDAA